MARARSAALIQHSSVFIFDSSGGDEAVASVDPHDRARAREVGGEDQRARVGVTLDELAAGLGGAPSVVAEATRPPRLGAPGAPRRGVAAGDDTFHPRRPPPPTQAPPA